MPRFPIALAATAAGTLVGALLLTNLTANTGTPSNPPNPAPSTTEQPAGPSPSATKAPKPKPKPKPTQGQQ